VSGQATKALLAERRSFAPGNRATAAVAEHQPDQSLTAATMPRGPCWPRVPGVCVTGLLIRKNVRRMMRTRI